MTRWCATRELFDLDTETCQRGAESCSERLLDCEFFVMKMRVVIRAEEVAKQRSSDGVVEWRVLGC